MAANRAGQVRCDAGPAQKGGEFVVMPFILTNFVGGWLAAGRTRGTNSGAARNCDIAQNCARFTDVRQSGPTRTGGAVRA